MEMTSEEIIRDYKYAKHRQNQIKILADRNLCSVEVIRQILIDGGVLKPRPRKTEQSVPEVPKPVKSVPALPEQPVLADWQNSLKILTERITELKQQKEAVEKELAAIYQALGELCEKG